MTAEATICDALMSVDADGGGSGPRAYAVEAGARICAIPEVRAARPDSAELVGFIHNAIAEDRLRGYDQYATAIIDRFGLLGAA